MCNYFCKFFIMVLSLRLLETKATLLFPSAMGFSGEIFVIKRDSILFGYLSSSLSLSIYLSPSFFLPFFLLKKSYIYI